MIDQNKYLNSYIDNTLGMLHEQMAQLLQTKSQLRVANDVISEKDNIIKNLQTELEQIKNNVSEKNIIAENAKKIEAEYNSLKGKITHMDSLVQQMTQMKKVIIDKEAAYNAMIAQKEATYNNMIKEKDGFYNKILIDKDAIIRKTLEDKDKELKDALAAKSEEIEKLKNKIAELQSPKKTINKKKPEEVSKLIVEKTPIVTSVVSSKTIVKENKTIEKGSQSVLPVVSSVVNEKVQQTRETDDF